MVNAEINGKSVQVPENTIILEAAKLTNSPKARQARRVNVELILSQHNARCAECVRSGNCELQKTANDLGINEFPYHEDLPAFKWNSEFPLIRDAQKCIKCIRCIQVCGQCITHCPVGALTVRDDTQKVRDAFAAKDKIMIASSCSCCQNFMGRASRTDSR